MDPDIDLWHNGGREKTSVRNLLLPCRDTSGFRKAGDKLQKADPCAAKCDRLKKNSRRRESTPTGGLGSKDQMVRPVFRILPVASASRSFLVSFPTSGLRVVGADRLMRFHTSPDLFEGDRLNPDVTNGRSCLQGQEKNNR